MVTEQSVRVCVTGGSGFVASLLIKQLLLKGYAVNTTTRDPGNTKKVCHLKELQSLGTLNIFRADLMEESSFDDPVSGCLYVFLVAAPMDLASEDPENELIKPSVSGTLNVMRSCVKARTVKRIVMTSSSAAVCINKLEGEGIVLDEEAYSDMEYLYSEKPPTWGYAVSKLLAEKEAMKFAEENNISVVTVNPPHTFGPALIADIPDALRHGVSLLSGNEDLINMTKVLQTVSGSVSMTHVEDTCRAHIFVAENESASGRYICCAVNTSLPELSSFLAKRYPEYKVATHFPELQEKPKIIMSSEKLLKAGFEFKYKKLEDIYDDAVQSAKVAGLLPIDELSVDLPSARA